MKLSEYEYQHWIFAGIILIGFSFFIGFLFQILNPTLVNVGFLEYFDRADALPFDLPFTAVIGLIVTLVVWILYVYKTGNY
ncbi:hypothetical protein LCGC14_0495370 [marine sediment metagenome]|uniref:Uncharacterized protein n=1 Tax=marine sediment metagenome TaxID=412755 RepID=A0A0F9S5G3_9ZZZZ|nr:hypothetical protein [bacterium]